MEELTLPRPDDWHVHLREGDLLELTLRLAARQFGRCVAMPNLRAPLVDAERIKSYADAIAGQQPSASSLRVLLTLFLTDATRAEQIAAAHKIPNFFAVKWYPTGVTTGAALGVRDITNSFHALAKMEELDIPLLIHGEAHDERVDVFEREAVFIDKILPQVRTRFPRLRLTLEHISTAAAVSYIREASDKTAASVTPQHLMFNRNHLLADRLNPHLYCKPLLKRQTDQNALRDLVSSGLPRVFLGSDSAPHSLDQKTQGCAGVFSAPCLMEAYTHVFEELGILDRLAAFACQNGATFYGVPPAQGALKLIKKRWQVPARLRHAGMELVPLMAGQQLNWRLSDDA